MNKSEGVGQKEEYFIATPPVKWSEIGVDELENLDFASDFLTDLEMFVIHDLIEKGPQSARKIWNNYCEYKLEEKYLPDDAGVSNTEYYDSIRSILSQKDIEYYSYHTIKTTLSTLKENGIVTTRKSNKGNTGDLYVINPRFKKNWRKRRNQLKTKYAEYQKVEPRILEFYDIEKEKDLDTFYDTERLR